MIITRNHFYHIVHVKYQNIIIIWDYHDSCQKSGKLRYQSITIKSSWEYTVAWKSIPQNSKLSCHVSLSFSNLSQVFLSCNSNKEEQTLTVIVWFILIIAKSVTFTVSYRCLLAVSSYLLSRDSIVSYHEISLYHREKKTFAFNYIFW